MGILPKQWGRLQCNHTLFLTGGGLGGGQHGGYGALYCDCTRCPWNRCYEQIVGTDKWG